MVIEEHKLTANDIKSYKYRVDYNTEYPNNFDDMINCAYNNANAICIRARMINPKTGRRYMNDSQFYIIQNKTDYDELNNCAKKYGYTLFPPKEINWDNCYMADVFYPDKSGSYRVIDNSKNKRKTESYDGKRSLRIARCNEFDNGRVLDLSPNDTYISFGVRFQDGTDHNTKFESKKYNKKLSIRESNEPIWQTKHSIWLGYLDEIQQGLEDLGETFPDLEKKLKSARWLRNGNEIHIPRGTQFTIEVDDVYENSWEYSVIRVHNGLMTGLPIILYDEASEKFKDRHCKLISESVGTLCNFRGYKFDPTSEWSSIWDDVIQKIIDKYETQYNNYEITKEEMEDNIAKELNDLQYEYGKYRNVSIAIYNYYH